MANPFPDVEHSMLPQIEFCDPDANPLTRSAGLHAGVLLDRTSITACNNGVAAKLTGQLRVLAVDEVDPARSWTVYQLLREGNPSLRLLFDDGIESSRLSSGSRVTVTGDLFGEVLVVSDTKILSTGPSQETLIGERRAVAFMVNLLDAPQDHTADEVRGTMYTNEGPDGDPMNMRDLYIQSTYGLLQFEPDADGDGVADVFDSIFIDANSADCSIFDWSLRADAAAVANGVDLDLYDFRIYVLSEQIDCGWAGTATTGGTHAWIRYIQPDLIAHEIGHLLSLGHSTADLNGDGEITGGEWYADYYTMMGGPTVGGNQLNTPHRLGWMTEAWPGSVLDVEQDGLYEICPVTGDHEQARALRFIGLDGNTYLASIRKYGPEWSGAQPLISGRVRLHLCPDGNCLRMTELLASLRVNDTYHHPEIDLRLRNLIRVGDCAIVDVGEYCVPQPPLVTVVPRKSSLCPGDLVSYEVVVENRDGLNCPSVISEVYYALFAQNLDPVFWTFGATDPIDLAPGYSHTFSIPENHVPLNHPTGDNDYGQYFSVQGSIAENWLTVVSPYQVESDCVPDSDGDTFDDDVDNCPSIPNDQSDFDGDTIGDACDNCSLAANSDQYDSNLDGFGNACDADFDQNCIVDALDLEIMKISFFLSGDFDTDLNGDSVINYADLEIMKKKFSLPPGPSGVPNSCEP